MSDAFPDTRLLQASVDPEDQSEFRILVDRKSIKYLTIDPGLYDVDDICFGPSLVSMLPPLPPGDWNQGHISLNTLNGRPHFARVIKVQLPAVTHLWPTPDRFFGASHGTKISLKCLRSYVPSI